MRRRFALVVTYDGTPFQGFQSQRGKTGIQDTLEDALELLLGHRVRLTAASRTDAGTHAIAQVVSFAAETRHDPETVLRALNSKLPETVRVTACHETALGFHPRRSAVSRWYRYTLLTGASDLPLRRETTLWVPWVLDVERMAEAASVLVGAHDFAALAGTPELGQSTVRRVLRWDVTKNGDEVLLDAEANGFLPQQVRRTNGVLLQVGQGNLALADVQAILDGDKAKSKHVNVLPARALCLMAIRYRRWPPALPSDGEAGKNE